MAKEMTTSHPKTSTSPDVRGSNRDGGVLVMGLSFVSPVGLAAGIDRNGENIASLGRAGFGYIEIGTVTRGRDLTICGRPEGLRIGVNIGSSRHGLNGGVIDDYVATLRQVYRSADYICANLTSPNAGRDGDSEGVGVLIRRLKAARDIRAVETGCRAPLLIKVADGGRGDVFPKAILEARRQDLDGIVLVSSCLRRIAAIKGHLGSMTLISVGGVGNPEQVKDRMNAGAALVQIHRAFFEGVADDLCLNVPKSSKQPNPPLKS